MDEKEVLGLQIARFDLLIEAEQGLPVKVGTLPGKEPPGVGIQTGGDAASSIAAIHLFGAPHTTARWRMALDQCGTTIIGHFVFIELDQVLWLLSAVSGDRLQPLHLGRILPVGRMHRASASPVDQLPAGQGPPDRCQAPIPQPRYYLSHPVEPPAAARASCLPRRLLQQAARLGLGLLRRQKGGKAGLRPRPAWMRSPSSPAYS